MFYLGYIQVKPTFFKTLLSFSQSPKYAIIISFYDISIERLALSLDSLFLQNYK